MGNPPRREPAASTAANAAAAGIASKLPPAARRPSWRQRRPRPGGRWRRRWYSTGKGRKRKRAPPERRGETKGARHATAGRERQAAAELVVVWLMEGGGQGTEDEDQKEEKEERKEFAFAIAVAASSAVQTVIFLPAKKIGISSHLTAQNIAKGPWRCDDIALMPRFLTSSREKDGNIARVFFLTMLGSVWFGGIGPWGPIIGGRGPPGPPCGGPHCPC